MNNKKLSILIAIVAMSICSITETASAAPSKILTFTNMPVWDYHQTNYDKHGNVRVNPSKTTFNLNGQKKKPSYIPMFKIKEVEVNSPISIECELKTDEQKKWYKNINKIVSEDSTKNPKLEQKLEFEKQENKIIIKGNQKPLDANKLYMIRIYSENYDPATIPVNIVQAKPIRVLVSYPMNPRTGEDVRFQLDNFNYAVLNPVNKVFLTHNKVRKELVKLEDYHIISDYLTVYAKDEENGEGNLLEPGKYTLEIYADGFKKAEKDFEIIKNEIKASGKNSVEKKTEVKPIILKSKSKSKGAIDTFSSASVGISDSADNSGSGKDSGGSVVMQANLVYNHDLLANALILNELGMGTEESEGVVKRFELNTIDWDAVISEDGTHINDFKDYLNAVKDASFKGIYLTYDKYIKSKEAKEYKNRPYNVKEVLEDNLLGEARNFRDVLGLESPTLKVKNAVMDKDMIIESDNQDYLKSIKAIVINGDMNELEKSLYSIKGNQLTISGKAIKGDNIKISILATGYTDNVIETKLEKVLDNINLKLEKEYKTGENVIVMGLSTDLIKNIKSITLDNKILFTKEQGGASSDTYYTISGEKLVLQGGLFNKDKKYKLEIDSKYYGKKELTFTIAKGEEKPVIDNGDNKEKKELPKMDIKIDDKSSFMKKYDIKFLNSGQWIKNITGITVNGAEYKSGLAWGDSRDHYAIYTTDELIGIGYEGFKKESDNIIRVKAKGYDEFTFIITKDGKIKLNQEEDKKGTTKKENKKEVIAKEKPEDSKEKDLRNMKVSIQKDSIFMKKYDMKFENSNKWIEHINKVSVNGVEYTKGISWGNARDHYSVQPVDSLIQVGYDSFKVNEDNVITISAEGYKDYIVTISKDGKLLENK